MGLVLGTCPTCGARLSLDERWKIARHPQVLFGTPLIVRPIGTPATDDKGPGRITEYGGFRWCTGEGLEPLGLPTPDGGLAGFFPLPDPTVERGPVQPYVPPRQRVRSSPVRA